MSQCYNGTNVITVTNVKTGTNVTIVTNGTTVTTVTNATTVTTVTVELSQMSPEGGLVSCGGSQQCHTLWQEDGFDGLTPAEAFGSGDYHHYDNEGRG